jgi:hypothetical protein
MPHSSVFPRLTEALRPRLFPRLAHALERFAEKGWDEKKHPRGQPGNKGEFGPGGADSSKKETKPGGKETKPAAGKTEKPKLAGKPQKPPPQKQMSEKALRAKAAHVMVDRDIQRYTEEHNEPRFAKVVGGESLPDSEPYDVGTARDLIELKTLVKNGNGKLTMDKYAQVRKVVKEEETGKVFHTVVSDDQQVFNSLGEGRHDDSKRVYYYRRGVAGSARIAAMLKVESEAELKKLMAMPEDQLPPAAKRTDGKLRSGKWEFVQTGNRGAGYYRNKDTGEEAHPKK